MPGQALCLGEGDAQDANLRSRRGMVGPQGREAARPRAGESSRMDSLVKDAEACGWDCSACACGCAGTVRFDNGCSRCDVLWILMRVIVGFVAPSLVRAVRTGPRLGPICCYYCLAAEAKPPECQASRITVKILSTLSLRADGITAHASDRLTPTCRPSLAEPLDKPPDVHRGVGSLSTPSKVSRSPFAFRFSRWCLVANRRLLLGSRPSQRVPSPGCTTSTFRAQEGETG